MAKTPKKQAKASSAKTETSKTGTPKAETKTETKAAVDAPSVDKSSTETTSSETATADAAPNADTTSDDAKPKASGGGRPISYFSSVSTPEYRSGWENIFGSNSDNGEPEEAKRGKKARQPVDLEIALEDLDADIQVALEAVAAKMAKRQRLKYDKLRDQNKVSWEITCRIAGE